MDTQELKLSAPWLVYYRKIEALFGVDPEIRVEFDEDNFEIELFVEDQDKANAIAQLLPATTQFGNIEVKTKVFLANENSWRAQIIQKAFNNSPILKDIQTVEADEMSNPMCFVIFKKEVVQYFSDNAGDIHGITSTLYQDLAKELLGSDQGIYFCTDSAQMMVQE